MRHSAKAPPEHVKCDGGGRCRAIAVGERPPKQWVYVGWKDGEKRYICPKCARKRRENR